MDIRRLALTMSLGLVAFGQGTTNLPLMVEPGDDVVTAAGYQTDVTLRFDADVADALDILRLVRSPGPAGWQVGDRLRRSVEGSATVIRASAGVETLLVISAPGRAGYLLEGPFRWPSHPSTRVVSSVWRRTVRGTVPEPGGTLTWVGGATDASPDAWPLCSWYAGGAWECVGVPLDLPGFVMAGPTGQFHAPAPGSNAGVGIEMTRSREAAWGRLVVVGRTDRAPLTVSDTVTAIPRRIVVPRLRPRSLRLEAVGDERVVSQRIGPHVFWVGGSEAPEGTWVEIAAAGRAPARVDVTDLAAAPAGQPVLVDLAPAVSIGGRVMTEDGRVVPGALLTLWRVLPARIAADGEEPPPRRVFVAETASDGDGRFGFTGLGEDTHEIVAFHSTRGRGEIRLASGERDVDVRLKRPSVAIGRIMRSGQPIGGVPVMVVPDLLEAAASEDLTAMTGGQARSGPDGRFQVAIPGTGRSEVRVGEASGIRRFPLGPGPSLPPTVDLGLIELEAASIPVRLVLEGAEGCDLTLSGPLGRSGLSLVPSQRIGPSMFEAAVPEPGQWLVSAACERRSRPVHPPSIDVQGAGPQIVPLVWR